MKKLIALLMVFCLLLPAAFAESDLLERLTEKGVITVAMEGTWAPWTYYEGDELTGFDVDVSKAIAEKLGLEAVFEECPWDSIFAGLASGRYDMIANGVEYSEERAESFAFSAPYAFIRTALIVRGDNEEINSFEDLAGKKTANTISSTYAKLGESYGAVTEGVDDLIQTILLVLQGRVDATLNAEVTFYDYMAEYPDANLRLVALTEDASDVCIALRKDEDSASFVEAVSAAIIELREEGVLSELSIKYFGADMCAE